MRARASHRGNHPPRPVHHAGPCSTARENARGRVVRGRQTGRIALFHEHITSHRIDGIRIVLRRPGQSFHRGSHKDAFTERYANASPISHTARSELNVNNTGRVCVTRAIFASHRRSARAIHETARRVVNSREFAILCLLPRRRDAKCYWKL